MLSAVESSARQALRRLLDDWELNWLFWPAHQESTQEDPQDWAQRLQARWWSAQVGEEVDPLVVVLEFPQDLPRLRALLSLTQPLPWLILLGLDSRNWLTAVPQGGNWFVRSEEPPAYAWPSWLREYGVEFWGSLNLEESKGLAERLEQTLTGGGRRLLHFYLPQEESLPKESKPPTYPFSSPPDSLEAAFLENLPQLLPAPTLIVWANSAPTPPPLARLRGLLRCSPQQASAAAWGARQADTFPLLVLSAGELGQALPGLLSGLPGGCLILILEAGLCWHPGETHLSPTRLRDLALLRQIHGLALTCPADLDEAEEILRLAYQVDTPLALRLSQAPAVRGPSSVPVEAGKAHCLRQGQHCAILALGPSVYAALLAAESLASWGIECQVWEVRFLKPLDRQAVETAAETGHILTVEEHCLQGGLATTTLETLSLAELRPKVHHLALPSTPPIEAGRSVEDFGLDADGIQKAMRQLLGITGNLASE